MNITKPRIIVTASALLVAAVIATGAGFASATPASDPVSKLVGTPTTSQTVDSVEVEVTPIPEVTPEVVTPVEAAPAPVVEAPAPAPAPVPILCPAGSTANASDGFNDTACFPNICFTIALPDAAHPECDVAFKP